MPRADDPHCEKSGKTSIAKKVPARYLALDRKAGNERGGERRVGNGNMAGEMREAPSGAGTSSRRETARLFGILLAAAILAATIRRAHRFAGQRAMRTAQRQAFAVPLIDRVPIAESAAPGARQSSIPLNPRRIDRRGCRPPAAIFHKTLVFQTRGGRLALARDGAPSQSKRSSGAAGLSRAGDQRREYFKRKETGRFLGTLLVAVIVAAMLRRVLFSDSTTCCPQKLRRLLHAPTFALSISAKNIKATP